MGVATCVRRVRVSSRRGVLAEHSVSGGASMMAAAATQHGCAALAEETSRRACSCNMMGSALLRTRVQRRKRERGGEKERQPDSNQIFTRLCENSKRFEYDSCRHFQKLQLWFQSKLHLSYGRKENLKFQRLGLEGLVIV